MEDIDILTDSMVTLECAITLASLCHSGQRDKSGQPYILHPLRVMMACQGDLDAMTVAVLHDTIEDTSLEEHELSDNYPEHIVEAVVALTRPPKGTPNRPTHMEDIKALKSNPPARKVKLADLKDNMDPVRMAQLEPGEAKGLMKRYEKAMEVLLEEEEA